MSRRLILNNVKTTILKDNIPSFRRGHGKGQSLVVIYDGLNSPEINMEKDNFLFQSAEAGKALASLRFYGWDSICITYGSNQKIDDIKKIIDGMKEVPPNIMFVKRPTGGGIVIHKPHLLTYSLVIPTMDIKEPITLLGVFYQISEQINNCLKEMGFDSYINKSNTMEFHEKRINPVCIKYPAKYEIMLNNHKIVGCAQKKGRKALLQQTQFFIEMDKELFQQKFECAIKEWLYKG